MPVEPFQIVNSDGTINQTEYQRCISFLEQYVQGLVPVYASMTWTNPFEVDLTQQHSSLYILRDIMTAPTNRLLTKSATDHIVNLFKATVSGLSRPYVMSYEQIASSKDWSLDSPGYCYDEATGDIEHQVYFEDCFPTFTQSSNNHWDTYDFHAAWKNDDYHTTISLGHRIRNKNYTTADEYRQFPSPTERLESFLNDNVAHSVSILVGASPGAAGDSIYGGNLLQLWTNPTSHHYKQSAALWYLSECNDPLMTRSTNWYDERLNTQYNVRYVSGINISNYGRGIPFDSLLEYHQEPTMFNDGYDMFANRAYVKMPTATQQTLNDYWQYAGIPGDWE